MGPKQHDHRPPDGRSRRLAFRTDAKIPWRRRYPVADFCENRRRRRCSRGHDRTRHGDRSQGLARLATSAATRRRYFRRCGRVDRRERADPPGPWDRHRRVGSSPSPVGPGPALARQLGLTWRQPLSATIRAMVARRSVNPSRVSTEVAITSGNAAGCWAMPTFSVSITCSMASGLTLSALVSTH